MDMLRAMSLFRAVADLGSFVAAADREGLSPPALSRQIASLEDRLGTRLFNRTTRSLSLTDAGHRFLARARVILQEIDEAEAEAGEGRAAPRGTLSVSAPISYSLARLGPILSSFRALYPDVRLMLDLTDRTVDLTHEAVDVALRTSATPDPALIERKLSEERLILCASPAYIERAAPLTHPDDLSHHDGLIYSYLTPEAAFTFHPRDTESDPPPTQARLSGTIEATNGDILRELAIAGHGVVIQPEFVVGGALAEGTLVELLPEWSLETFGIYAVYQSRRHLPLKTRVFIDHLVSALGPKAESPSLAPLSSRPATG